MLATIVILKLDSIEIYFFLYDYEYCAEHSFIMKDWFFLGTVLYDKRGTCRRYVQHVRMVRGALHVGLMRLIGYEFVVYRTVQFCTLRCSTPYAQVVLA